MTFSLNWYHSRTIYPTQLSRFIIFLPCTFIWPCTFIRHTRVGSSPSKVWINFWSPEKEEMFDFLRFPWKDPIVFIFEDVLHFAYSLMPFLTRVNKKTRYNKTNDYSAIFQGDYFDNTWNQKRNSKVVRNFQNRSKIYLWPILSNCTGKRLICQKW